MLWVEFSWDMTLWKVYFTCNTVESIYFSATPTFLPAACRLPTECGSPKTAQKSSMGSSCGDSSQMLDRRHYLVAWTQAAAVNTACSDIYEKQKFQDTKTCTCVKAQGHA